ncbi:MAG TPA: ATP-dependent sacrificial sulfur transferase LarE [Planctomycetaceae bacterium]|nr:ATP-dependent sacrificial sulfur transferase LarE [Planctomycetaceae bacterium]
MTTLTNHQTFQQEQLLCLISTLGRVGVAFSGGVDSAVVARAAREACGERAVAITAVSPSLPSGEWDEAQRLAREIGIRHQRVDTSEFTNPDYLRNAPNRCYFCKSELYGRLESLAPQLGIDVLLNGANLDDQGDWRPGMKAAREFAVRSPLIEVGMTKADVRALARHWGLSAWDKPATPCLSSRIAYGLEVTPERVSRVDRAEQFLRTTLGVRELRVRHEVNDLARLELPLSTVTALLDPVIRQKVSDELHALGFRYVTLDLDGFRSGSMNMGLSLVDLAVGPPSASS